MKLSNIIGLRILLPIAFVLGLFGFVQANSAFQVDGGTISTTDATTFCTTDGIADIVNVSVTDSEGPFSLYVVTDENGNILYSQSTSSFDFSNSPAGKCNIYHIAFKAFLFPPLPGTNVGRLVGWYGLSNALEITKTIECEEPGEEIECDDVEGGTLSGGPFSFCVGDGEADFISEDQIVLAFNEGSNSQWVITDADGNILGLPPTFSVVDFDEAGVGACLVWHLSFEDGLDGAEVGNNASELEGCFSLSNPITVNRDESGGACGEEVVCDVEGGTLSGGPFSYCVGDGEADNINPDQIVLAFNEGSNSQWVITDADGNILGLPPTFSVVDFDEAGIGACLVWHLSFEDGLTGAEVGNNASELEGCFSLSNPITVNRDETGGACGPAGNDNDAEDTNDADPVGDACGVNSGTIELVTGGTNINVCTSDGVDDSFKVNVSDNTGDSFWVILDADRNLLAQQDMNMFDFEGLPGGLCIICHVSFSGEITGLVIGEPVGNVEGCVDFSNEISVTRFEDDPTYCFDVGSAQEEGGLSFNTITNPVDDQLRLEIKSTEKGPHHVIIYDIVGRTLFNNVINIDQDDTQVEIEVSEFEKGLHFINVTNSTKAAVKTFMKRGF